MSTYRFTLFVAGQSPRSTRALENLRALCERVLPGDYDLAVVDVVDAPAEAEADRVLATPTLIKRSPDPVRRVTGDLSDHDALSLALGLPR